MFRTLTLTSMRLPDGCGWRRDPVLKSDAIPANHADRYDFSTLIYSATYTKRERGIVLVCPKFLKLEALLNKGRFTSDQGTHPIRKIRAYRRHTEVSLGAATPPQELSLTTHDMTLTCPVHSSDDILKGAVVLQTLSKDNDLGWIKNWASHHVRHQGITHVLIFDNGSTRYSPEDVTDTLRTVSGLNGATVVSAPLPYGPLGTKTPLGRALFLQVGLLYTARHRFVSRARAVLYCDTDEVLISGQGRLVDAAERSFLGFATAKVMPRFTNLPKGQEPTHGDHILKRLPDRPAKEKWCLLPQGRLRNFAWDSHGVARYQFNWLAMRNDHRFYHCEHLSTHWGRRRGVGEGEIVVHDPQTADHLSQAGLR